MIGTATLATTATFTLDADRGIATSGTSTVSAGTGTTLTYGGTIAGTGALAKTGTGTLVLSGASTYTGTTTISAGILSIADDTALGAVPDSPTPGRLVIGTATLATTATFTLDADRGIATSGTSTVSAGTGTTLTYGGTIAGTGALAKTGTGTLVLSGASTYTGITTISAGVIRVQHESALGSTAGGTTVTSGAAIEIDGSGLALALADAITSLNGTGVGGTGAIRNLAGANSWSGAITMAANSTVSTDAGTLTLGAIAGNTRTLTIIGAGNTTIGGVIATTTGALIKNGTGTLTLGGASTYTGATTVNAGTLDVNGSTAGGGFTVAAGATLGGSGTVGGTVSVSGTLSPGSSAGRLTNGALTLVAASTFAVEIGGTTPASQHDQDRVASGAITIGAGVQLSLVTIGGFTPTIGQTFLILDKASAGAISGTFTGLPQGSTIATFLGSALSAQISYTAGDGNDVVLTVLP